VGTLTGLTVSAFDAEVASASPAPGGGSAAALAGSVAAGLVAMVCRLSLGRDDIAASAVEIDEALAQSERLRSRLLELVDEDTAAFDAVMDAVRMPKEGDAQREARREALARATLGAAAVPVETLAATLETLQLASRLAGRANPAAVSDLGVAVHLARAGAEGALLNVEINLSALPDGDDVRDLRRRSQTDIARARTAATAAAAAIARSLGLD
jgi:formiminotetrahydrofolate cyclodeaminase